MNQRRMRILGFAGLAVGAILYLLGVSGVLWPATPPGDVGLIATAGVFVIFGAIGLALSRGEGQGRVQ